MRKILEVILSADYLVTVQFDQNQFVTINMKKKLHTARFSELRNKQVFNEARTDGHSVNWPGGISIAISEIMEMVAE